MIRRIALYAIRFSASKGKNGKDFSVFFQWDYAFRGILRSVSSSIFISFILRNARIEIPFHLKREQKKKNRCKNFSWKNLHRLKEREREGRKNRPAPYILDKQWNNRTNGNRRCSRLSARVACRGQATSPVFFIRKKRHLHPLLSTSFAKTNPSREKTPCYFSLRFSKRARIRIKEGEEERQKGWRRSRYVSLGRNYV